MVDMFRKKPILRYQPLLESFPNSLTPAKNKIPTWYKEILKWKNNEMFSMQDGFQHTVKQCMPFLDSLTTGYTINLPYDIYVTNNAGFPWISWKSTDDDFFPSSRPEVSNKNLVPHEFYPTEYTWKFCVAYQVPKGYSCLITHPLNRYDLPFQTLGGIVDGEMIFSGTGNVPFYIKKGFEGIIPQGTPIAQLIPFHQQNWSSKIEKGLSKIAKDHETQSLLLITGWYKKTFWTRKKYD